MSRYLADRPTLADADDLFINQAVDYFTCHRSLMGPAYAAERTAIFIEDHLTERQTGVRRPHRDFWQRELRRHWDEVAVTHRDTAVAIANLMKDGNIQDARCALAATLDAIEPDRGTDDRVWFAGVPVRVVEATPDDRITRGNPS